MVQWLDQQATQPVAMPPLSARTVLTVDWLGRLGCAVTGAHPVFAIFPRGGRPPVAWIE